MNGQAITGTEIGTDISPCWPVNDNFSYRADVTSLVNGNGSYALSGFASGQTNGQDPWDGSSVPVPPLLEGASLVVIYTSPLSAQTQILLYDGSAEAKYNLVTLTLSGFTAPSPLGSAVTTFIGADGQSLWEEGSTFNGNTLPSVGWDGLDPQAVPSYSDGNLWDTMPVNVTGYVAPGSTSATATTLGGDDCLVWVAQVL